MNNASVASLWGASAPRFFVGFKYRVAPFFSRFCDRMGILTLVLRRRFPLLSQQLFQHADPLIDVFFFQQIWRQEAHDRILRAVE